MSANHTTVSAQIIKAAAALADAHELDVKRTLLGLLPLRADRSRVVAALVEAGADADFLARLSAATDSNTTVDRRPISNRR
jgi:hypothetical protein